MVDLWGTNGGIYFGFGSNRTEGAAPKQLRSPIFYVGDRHIVTLGPNGSGKSRRLLLPNLGRLTGWSILVVDPKGELAYMSAEYREKHKNRPVVLNPFNVLGLESHGFNPLRSLIPGDDDFPDDAMSLAEALIRVEGKEPHWGQSAQDLVCALIMYVRLVLPNASMSDVRALLGQSSTAFRQTVLAKQIKYKTKTIPGMLETAVLYDCPELDAKASRFSEITPDSRELLGIMSTALTQTRWLDSRPVKADLAKSTYDFGRLKNEATTVYLILPARRLGTHSTWLRLMITSILMPLMRDTRKAKVPVLFMLDEFAQLGHLPVIEQNLALMRGYGIKLWTVFQDLAQAQDIYDRRWESFFGNAGVLQAFAPQDLVTADYLSARMGQTTRTALAGNVSGENTGINLNQIAVPAMLPQDIRNMDPGFSVIFSHKLKGPTRAYMPYPKALPELAPLVSRDPAD